MYSHWYLGFEPGKIARSWPGQHKGIRPFVEQKTPLFIPSLCACRVTSWCTMQSLWSRETTTYTWETPCVTWWTSATACCCARLQILSLRAAARRSTRKWRYDGARELSFTNEDCSRSIGSDNMLFHKSFRDALSPPVMCQAVDLDIRTWITDRTRTDLIHWWGTGGGGVRFHWLKSHSPSWKWMMLIAFLIPTTVHWSPVLYLSLGLTVFSVSGWGGSAEAHPGGAGLQILGSVQLGRRAGRGARLQRRRAPHRCGRVLRHLSQEVQGEGRVEAPTSLWVANAVELNWKCVPQKWHTHNWWFGTGKQLNLWEESNSFKSCVGSKLAKENKG